MKRCKIVVVCFIGISLLVGCNQRGVLSEIESSSSTHGEYDGNSTVEETDKASEKSTNDSEAAETETVVTTTTSGDKVATKELFAMDTYMTLTAYGENGKKAVDAAADEVKRLDAILSTGDEECEVAKLNANGGGELSEDVEYLLKKSMELYTDTDGLFDIAIYPIMEAWGFPTQEYRVPEKEELESLLALADVSKIDYNEDDSTVTFGIDGMEIDFGGIAKGYTSFRIMEIYKENGVTSGLVNLGGNVQVLGSKTDGNSWKVGIQDPEGEEDYLGAISIKDQAVITSGGYERYFEKDGKTYHHIIDPRTGYPAESGLISVSIVSEDGTLADGLSTSLFIMGKDDAIKFWKKHSDEFDAILETKDETLYVTEGIADEFEVKGHQVEVVEK